jgi:hypothetical protein
LTRWLPLLVALAACPDDPGSPEPNQPDRGEAPGFTAQAPVLRRLTYSQYVATVADLFGEGLVLAGELEPDSRVSGLYAIGAGVTSISSLGVERYESAAYDIAAQVMADPDRKARVLPCTPEGVQDDACAAEALSTLGRRAWRRPLTDEERARLVAIANTAATTLGSFDSGFEYAMAALLQSPNFLFRPEPGEPDPDRPGQLRYTGWEMASRLSYFLWNSTPDDTLLDAAAAGELVTEAGIAAQVDRMLADDRAREGLRAFLSDMLQLDGLDTLTKDPLVYAYASSALGPSAREQTLLDAESIVFDKDADFRTLLTSTETHLDRTLAAVYDVPAPVREGFGVTTLPADGGRRGFLGQVSFLALQSHATSTSVTRRGLFIREVLLCQELPSPPAGLNTSIPETTEETPTMRDRVEQHLEDPTCASCHLLMDPIGLGLENFDGVGRWRTEENGATIDASGDLDGVAFADGWALGGVIADDEAFPGCVSRTLYTAANGRVVGEGEGDISEWHDEGFRNEAGSLRFLMRDIAVGSAFRTVGAVTDGGDTDTGNTDSGNTDSGNTDSGSSP